MALQKDFYYSEDHEWINVAPDEAVGTTVRVGITNVAADRLGEIVFAELPQVGDTVAVNEQCGEVESTKSVSDLFSPLSGTVTEVNQAVVDSPELVNSSPFEDGWLIKARFESLPEDLLDEAGYKAITQS